MNGGDKDKDKAKQIKREQNANQAPRGRSGLLLRGRPWIVCSVEFCWQSSRINPIAFAIQLGSNPVERRAIEIRPK